MTWSIQLVCALMVLKGHIMGHLDTLPWNLMKESKCDMKSNELYHDDTHGDSQPFTTETYVGVQHV